jgi:hypothetical protein
LTGDLLVSWKNKMEPARKIQEEESEFLFLSPKTQEKQAILQQFQLIALEKQNRRLKIAVTLLSVLLLAAIAGAGYLYHKMQFSGRAAGPARQEALQSRSLGSLPSRESATVRSSDGGNDAVQREAPAPNGEAKARPSSNADVTPVIIVKFREQGTNEQPGETREADHDPGAPSSSPASSSAPASESATQPEGAAQVIEAKPVARYVGSKTSNRYHFPDCKWVKLIHPERLIGFASVEEARKTHPIACPTCRPPLKDAPESAAPADTKP